MNKVRLILKSFDHRILDENCKILVSDLLSRGLYIKGPIFMPSKIKKWTLLAGPTIDKNARQQLELRYFKRLIDIDAKDQEKTVLEIFSNRSFNNMIEFSIKIIP